jgi:uncharacterized protein
VIPGPARDPRIDALRGFALLGILLVNIQSFISGAPNAIGYLAPDSGAADRIAYFLTATFVVGKFMPLFGMLFGASFALLYDKLRASFEEPRRLYRRRLGFLMAFGLLHALFLYFGDITLAYAIAGFVLLRHTDSDASQLARATTRWWIFAAAWMLLSLLSSSGVASDAANPLVEMVERNEEAAMTLDYAAQWPLRAEMAVLQMQSNLLGLPSVIALMMTGALAQRAGWLRNLDNPGWRRAALFGLALGLPATLAYGGWAVGHAGLEASMTAPAAILGVQASSVVLAFFYAATFLRRAPASIVAWLSPAGRMPLTNYLLQSLAMSVLLPGWGFGLGAAFGYAQLSVLAVAVFVVQLLASRWWLARFEQGPLEAIWRGWTYRGAVRKVA